MMLKESFDSDFPSERVIYYNQPDGQNQLRHLIYSCNECNESALQKSLSFKKLTYLMGFPLFVEGLEPGHLWPTP